MKNKDGGEGGGGLINFLPLKRGCSSKKKVKKCLRPKKNCKVYELDNRQCTCVLQCSFREANTQQQTQNVPHSTTIRYVE